MQKKVGELIMKYTVVIFSGMADRPDIKLKRKTPMSKANTANMNLLARKSEVGIYKAVQHKMPQFSDVCTLSVMGYNPMIYYTGSSAFEVLETNAAFDDEDVVFFCNFVSLSDEEKYSQKIIIQSDINDVSQEETDELFKFIQKKFNNEIFFFCRYKGTKNFLVWKKGEIKTGEIISPYSAVGKELSETLPKNEFMQPINKMMKEINDFLENHPINIKRIEEGKLPVNAVWVWGTSKRIKLPCFKEKFCINASIVTDSEYSAGLGKHTGMKVYDVFNGTLEEKYQKIAEYSVQALNENNGDKNQIVFVHIDEPNKYGLLGMADEKVKSIELADKIIIKRICDELEKKDEPYKIMILSGNAAPHAVMANTAEPVPYLIYTSNSTKINFQKTIRKFDEENAALTEIFINGGYNLIDKFLNEDK